MKKPILKLITAVVPFLFMALSLTASAQRRDTPKKAPAQESENTKTSQLPVDKKTKTTPIETSTTGKTKTKPTGQNLSERQKGNIKQLEADIKAIKQGSQVTQEQKNNLQNSLMAMAEGATKPNPVAVQKLADDLAEALSDGRLSASEQYKLSEDLEAVMNSANIPEAEVEKAIADAQAILIASGVDKSDVQTIAYDMKQVSAEGKKNAQSAAEEGKKKAQGLKRKQ